MHILILRLGRCCGGLRQLEGEIPDQRKFRANRAQHSITAHKQSILRVWGCGIDVVRSNLTMSGRLIILPKKSYCPWKPENVERVLRDERLERERQAQLDEADEKKRSEDRVQLLKTKRGKSGARSKNDKDVGTDTNDTDDDAGTGTALEHVNLFADEEKAMMEKAVSGDGPVSEADKTNQSSAGIMPLCLGGEEAARRRGEKSVPFYLQPSAQSKSLGGDDTSKHVETEALRVKQDECLKRLMDPMQEFCGPTISTNTNGQAPAIPTKEVGHANNERERRRHRRKRCDSYTSSSSESDDSNSCSSPSSTSKYVDSRRKKKERRKRKHGKERDSRDGAKRKSTTKKDERRRKDKKRSSRRNSKGSSAQPHSSVASIDELRRRRQLREQKEAERSFMVRLEDQSLSGAAGYQHKYQDQYNPSLSNK